jgi:hypothetical protein
MNMVLNLSGEDNGKGFKFILLVVLLLGYLKIMILKKYGNNIKHAGDEKFKKCLGRFQNEGNT